MKLQPVLSMALPILALGLSGACGGSSYETVGTNTAVGADATIEVEKLDGGNAMVTFEARHLPPPSRLGEGLKVYVMWFLPENAPAQRVAIVDYDEDDREGKAMATTMEGKLEVRVTAEKGPTVSTPSDKVVIKKKILARD